MASPAVEFPFVAIRQRDTIFRDAMVRALSSATEESGARAQAGRSITARRQYALARDPWAYFHDILGWELTEQQEGALELMERETRVLIPSANNLGKTFLIAGFGLYLFDACAALEDPDGEHEEQGARILLPGPDHNTVFGTIYSEMLAHANRAELRGHLLPGMRSEKSVLWRVRPKWNMEVFSPAKRKSQQVAHTASGRHHPNQHALVEEGQGVEEPLWRGIEGMCSSAGNKIISPFNPTEPIGPAYQRAKGKLYHVYHLDAFDHPNIVRRKPVIPAAIDFHVVDGRVRSDCGDRGPFPGTPVDEEQGDFVYALPLSPKADQRPRTDGVAGARGGKPRVYRPGAAFMAQVRGRWPLSSESGLFDAASWDRGVRRWLELDDPQAPPDRVGVDPAREGMDDTCSDPAWGPDAGALLRAYAQAEAEGAKAIAALQSRLRTRVGMPVIHPKGKGPAIAIRLDHLYPRSPFSMDEGSVGSSPIDYLTHVLHRDAVAVSFSAAPLPPAPGEPWCENMRTQLYVRAAMAVARGLVDPPDEPLLREEILAHEIEHTTKTVDAYDAAKGHIARTRVPAVALVSKDRVKEKIGRSPDRSDAFVLSLYQQPAPARGPFVPASRSYVTI